MSFRRTEEEKDCYHGNNQLDVQLLPLPKPYHTSLRSAKDFEVGLKRLIHEQMQV
jgi:hypothetical protein